MRLDDAIAEYREAIRLNPEYATAHNNLGNSLATKGELDEAIAEYLTALEINAELFEARANLAMAHNNRGNSLAQKGDLDGAIDEFHRALEINKNLFEAHANLGNALRLKGQLKEAIAEFQVALRIKDDAGVKAQLKEAERLAQLEERLPDVLEDKDKPKDAAEWLGFAELCQPPFRKLCVSAARFYEKALAAEPKLIEDPHLTYRYNAACAAALAGCGQGTDADKLHDSQRAGYRRRALDWLRADLEAIRPLLEKDSANHGPFILATMQHWLADEDFVGVRGPEALAKLPEAERQRWEKLWKDVADLLNRAQEKAEPQKK